MIRKILGTTFSKIIITIGGIIILLMNTHFLGVQGLGELSLLLVALHLVLQFSELVGGPSLVYLQNKYNSNKILSSAYLWATIVAISAFVLLHFFIDNPQFIIVISLSAFIQSLNHCNLHLLVGMEEIKNYNFSTLIQFCLVLPLIVLFYVFFEQAEVITYLWIYFAGQVITFLLSTSYLWKSVKQGGSFGFSKTLVLDLYRYGLLIQLANIFQYGVYRINYLVLESFTSLSTLGAYSLGNQLSEKAFIPSNAIGTIQYAKISNSDNDTESAILSIHLLSLSLSIGLFSSLVIVFIPESMISWIFGADFSDSHSVLKYLAPGIVFMSGSAIYSHYFAGLGQHQFNTITSFIGLILIAGLSYTLIPDYGMIGAAIATSIVYFVQMIFQAILFKKVSKLSLKEIIQTHRIGLSHINLNTFKNLF